MSLRSARKPRPVPSDAQKRDAHARVEELATGALPKAFFYQEKTSGEEGYMFAGKLMPETWLMLSELGLRGTEDGEQYRLEDAMGLTLMSIVADCCAGETKARVTDRTLAYRKLNGILLEKGVLKEADSQSVLLRRDADLAIRMTEPKQQALLVKPVGRIRLALYAHRDYLARSAPVGHTADLSAHAIIGFDRDAASVRSLDAVWPDLPAFALRTDNQLAQIAMIRAGCGIGVMQIPIARRDPALVAVLRDVYCAHLPVWIAMHEELRSTRRMRVVFDTLVEGMTAHVEAGAD